MTRNLIVLGCAGLLAVGLSISSFAGVAPDTDGDGISDDADNCVIVANGPDASTGSCNSQEDGDSDGYGNPCDTDTNNDGGTGLDDVGFVFDAVVAGSSDPNYDFNCDGGAGLDDVGRAFDDVVSGAPPGPSGLACAGTVPCP